MSVRCVRPWRDKLPFRRYTTLLETTKSFCYRKNSTDGCHTDVLNNITLRQVVGLIRRLQESLRLFLFRFLKTLENSSAVGLDDLYRILTSSFYESIEIFQERIDKSKSIRSGFIYHIER